VTVLIEITATGSKMQQGRTSTSSSGNYLTNTSSPLWRWVMKMPAKEPILSNGVAVILVSVILGIVWFVLG